MAEETPSTSVPAPEAAESTLARPPDTAPEATPADAAPPPAAEQETEKPTVSEEQSSGKEYQVHCHPYIVHDPFCLLLLTRLDYYLEDATATETAPEEKKEPAEAPTEAAAEPAKPSDAKEPEPEPEPSSAAPAESAPAPQATEAPSSAKKGGNSKRKSTGAVPEHKNKLSRKKSQIRVTQLHAKPGEYYLAHLRSYPPWPSIVCDEDILPQSLLTTRPVSAMRPDGSYREDYADEGKRAHERTFPVMFFGTNEL